MLLGLALLFGAIVAYKLMVKYLTNKAISSSVASRVVTVSVMKVDESTWQNKLPATGSLRAIKGVNVTTELAGMVQKIFFTPGSYVNEKDVLVQLNADDDIASLQAQKANAKLAQLTYVRDQAQYKIHAISKQVLDNDEAKLENINALVAQQEAVVLKKTIRAPFSGYLGINYVNPGQYLNPGDKVSNLQSLDPIYADFYMPQQVLAQLQPKQEVLLKVDTFPDKSFQGNISTIESIIDVNTRNVAVEATFANPDKYLKPGMFVKIEVTVGKPQSFITVPQTAITFNSYGNLVYIVMHSEKDKNGTETLTVKQRFVTVGETRGEQIQVLSGLKKGEEIVTSGQLKLRNDSKISINNAIAPSDNPSPALKNNH
jgi:membrane fusion protein (multidrug efflux system)